MILLVAEIAGGVWAYTNSEQLNKMISDSIQDTVRNYSKDKIKSNAFDLIQKEVKSIWLSNSKKNCTCTAAKFWNINFCRAY